MNKLRKSLVIGVMVLTVFATMGMYAPVKASASAGDLIKMDGLSSVYYLGSDGKRYVFPNSTTYFSWYTNFDGVITIPASELQSYPLGGNVTMRAGTKLVKITTDPSVYAVEPNGVLRKIQSEAQAAALYGSNWNKRVVDVPDAFFTNYTIGSALANGSIPAGSLVKNASGAEIFYFDGTNYRSIASESAFNANRFAWGDIITAGSTVTAGGTSLSSAEFTNVAQNGGNGTVTTGSGLMVSLNANTPAATSIPQNGSRVPFAKVNLTAANDGAVSVNSITVKRIGLSTYSNVDKVWAEKDGVIVASKKSMNSSDESILTFSPALIVNAGQTVTLDFIVSLTGTGSGNMGLSIATASAVSSTGASVTGSFPINSNIMSLTSYSVVNLSISGANTATSTLKVGDEKVELGHFELGFNGTAKDVSLKSIMLKNNGVEDLTKATMNLYLEQAGNKVSTSYTINGRYVTFYFPTTGLDLLKDDASKIFYVKGDVIAKENTATNSFQFTLNKSSDIVAYEKSTGFGANVYAGTSGTTSADGYVVSNIAISSGAVSVSKKSTSPSDTTIIKGSDNVVLLANVRADEAITADGINILYSDTATTTNQFENVRVYVNGILLDSFDPSATSTLANESIDSTLTLNKGDNEIKVMAKAKTTAIPTATFQVKLDGNIFSSPSNKNPQYVVSGNSVPSGSIAGSATGGIFTVQGATLTTVISDGYANDKPIVKGSTDVSLGKFTVKATNDTAKVTSISFGANVGAATATLDSSISDMKLYVDGVQVGSTVDFGSTGANFSSLNFDIAKDSTKAIELKGSFDSSAVAPSNFKTVMTINAQDSRGSSISGGNVATTTNFVIADAGSLNVALGGSTPSEAMLATKSGVEQEVAQFKFTAVNDSANITEINLINTPIASTTIASTSDGVADADARIASVKLYDGSNLIDSFVPVNGEGKFTINSNQVVIAANANKTLSIKVVLNDISNDDTATNKDIHFGITTMKFKSSAGSETTQGVALLANNFRLRKTIPTVAYQELTDKTLNAGDKVIAKFTVTADSNADVTLGKLVLVTSNTASATIATTTNPLKVNGSNKTATATIGTDDMTILLGTPEVIAAGTTKTFEVLATVGVSGTGSESITAKIVEDTPNYAVGSSVGDVSGSFVWSDNASVSTDTYANGHRVNGLTTTTWVLSK